MPVGPESLPGFEGLIGQSAVMRVLFQHVTRLAATDASILIVGESGTGKELVARALHARSPRRGARFAPVNCGALKPDLVRSELFGHEKGAFTGATEPRTGLLRAAPNGTVFLDEVGRLPLDAQAPLLRFLDSGETQPVGAARPERVDVRILAATNRDLVAAVEQGGFAEDLFYRLAVVVLELPPLRARLEDLPLLVEHHRRQLNARYHLGVEGVTPAALDVLARHPWPGNVRELAHVLEAAMLLTSRRWLEPEDLAFRRVPRTTQRTGAAPGLDPAPAAASPPPSASPGRREAALELAASPGGVTSGQLARACRISGECARRELVALARASVLRREGDGRGTRYVRP